MVGEGHQITGNHIQGVGDRVDGAIALSAGVVDANKSARAGAAGIDSQQYPD